MDGSIRSFRIVIMCFNCICYFVSSNVVTIFSVRIQCSLFSEYLYLILLQNYFLLEYINKIRYYNLIIFNCLMFFNDLTAYNKYGFMLINYYGFDS